VTDLPSVLFANPESSIRFGEFLFSCGARFL